ncbi:uncharacterized protein BO87DRAFT_298575, partial [Aspergillus neoniger CBS 115656]
SRANQATIRQMEKMRRKTTFTELIRECHEFLSKPIKVESPSGCTKGTIPPPTGKVCPDRFEHWDEFEGKLEEIYRSVCKFLEPTSDDEKRYFSSIDAIRDTGQQVVKKALTSEKDLEIHEKITVENHVERIITELSNIPEARETYRLDFDNVHFMNHLGRLQSCFRVLNLVSGFNEQLKLKPDSVFFTYDRKRYSAPVLAGEYKPPHKLPVETLRAGLRTHDFYEEIVASQTIPTEAGKVAEYRATRLTGSALVQGYHAMILIGLEYGYVTTGLGIVLLRVPSDNPRILQWHLCEPNEEVAQGDDQWFTRPLTAIARILCITLMGFGSQLQTPSWSAKTKESLNTWTTSFDVTYYSQINDPTTPEDLSDKSYHPPGPGKDPESTRRIQTRSRRGCRESTDINQREDKQDPDPDSVRRKKRRFSDSISSTSPERELRSKRVKRGGDGTKSSSHLDTRFCTHKCLLGLRRRGNLDRNCPNFELHQENGSNNHRINTHGLVKLIKTAILDCAEPMGECGLSGAPFKITCPRYGYTIVGKGTTCYLWPQLKREADIYRMLQPVQGSAIPVFIGKLDMHDMIFLWGVGKIRHMLLMGWGGEEIEKVEVDKRIMRKSRSKSNKDIKSLGVNHQDLEWRNVLWSAELNRAVIIDFHLCTFNMDLVKKKPKWLTGENPMLEGIKKDQERLHCEYHGVCLHPPDGKCPNVLLDIY